MIGRVLYRESVQGVLNYVFGKQGMTILGYQNTCSENISQKFFGNVLHFQGQLNASQNRYVHITLNLPHDEHLEDSVFYEVSKEYMQQMGYGEQPFVVVRHNDTKHEHVHIVSTNVKEAGTLIDLSHPYKRNVATQWYLEKKYGLLPSPKTKQKRELPVYRLPEIQFGMDESQGTKFYLQDVLNSILQKYKVRSFGELSKLVKPYHIFIKQTKNDTGRVGVAYGLNNQKDYQTRFINGSIVHPNLSGPKLQKAFDINSKDKLIPLHRKRLNKQIQTTYNLFKVIHSKDFPNVLKAYQNMDVKLDTKWEAVKGFTVYDKSGYMFQDKEISSKIVMKNNLDIFGNDPEPTQIDTDSKQFKLEIQKLIKEAFYTFHLKSPQQRELLSESISVTNLNDIHATIRESKKHLFLEHYISRTKREKVLKEALKKEFPTIKKKLHQSETRKEIETLNNKFQLIDQVLENGIFDIGKEKGSIHRLFQSLGVKYNNNRLSFSNSNSHMLPVAFGDLPLPKAMDEYVSTGFVRQNHIILESLVQKGVDKDAKLGASSIFLPMVFPKLYETMDSAYKQQYEKATLAAYLKHAERMHSPYEKSPEDYIAFFNAKGFYFERTEKGFEIKSIYMDTKISCPLSKRTSTYLNSISDLDVIFKEQKNVITGLIENKRNNLKNLWAGHLLELGRYNKVAFMLTREQAHPNLHQEIVQHHMKNGLRKSIIEVSEQKINSQQNHLLKKSVYAISSLLGNRNKKHEEVYNGFKDELTDYSKYKSKGLSW